jgi:hypothetical protein
VEDQGNDVLVWMLAIALFIIFVLPACWLVVRRIRQKKRRRLVDSPRKIVVAPPSPDAPILPAACAHQRSKSRARPERDGSYTSICRKCGVPMKRNGPGDWEVAASAGGVTSSSPRGLAPDSAEPPVAIGPGKGAR